MTIDSILSLIESKNITQVFIDVDDTLINGNSGYLFAKFLYKKGAIKLKDISTLPFKMVLYKLGLLNYNTLLNSALKIWKGKHVSELESFGDEFYHQHIKKLIFNTSPKLIERLKRKPLNISLISASPIEVLSHLAKELNVRLIATQLEKSGDLFTGKIIGPLCYGSGKLELIQKSINNTNRFCALSDSITDFPMLNAADLAIAINPDFQLRKKAHKNGWAIFKFE